MPRKARRDAAQPRLSETLLCPLIVSLFPQSLYSDTIPIALRPAVQRNSFYPAGPAPAAGAAPSDRDSAR